MSKSGSFDWRLHDIRCSSLLRVISLIIDFGLSTSRMVEIRSYAEVLTTKDLQLTMSRDLYLFLIIIVGFEIG